MGRGMTPAQVADKQIKNLSASTEFITMGVNAVTESPMEKAAQNLDKAAKNYTEAITSGKTGDRLRAVTLGMWKEKTLAKVDRVASGAGEARGKIVDFHTQRAAHQETINAELAKIPTKTAADMERRMLAQMKAMRNFRFVPGR